MLLTAAWIGIGCLDYGVDKSNPEPGSGSDDEPVTHSTTSSMALPLDICEDEFPSDPGQVSVDESCRASNNGALNISHMKSSLAPTTRISVLGIAYQTTHQNLMQFPLSED